MNSLPAREWCLEVFKQSVWRQNDDLNSAGFLGALFYVYSIATFDVGAALLAKCAPLPTLFTRAIFVIRTGALADPCTLATVPDLVNASRSVAEALGDR